MASSSDSTLHSPYKMGKFSLSHRIVLAPMSRYRSYYSIPQPHAALYYAQRATNGGLLISEAVGVSPIALGVIHAPGIWSKEQVEAWRPITRAVHEKNGIFFCQIGHVGRVSDNAWGEAVSSTHKKLGDGWATPKPLETAGIEEIVDQFRVAARNAVEAGFDGVEICGAHGLLIDQFLRDGVNIRRDRYGGSIENRCRFATEIVNAVVQEIGGDRVGIKLSPFNDHLGCVDRRPDELGLYMAKTLNNLNICYLHVLADAKSMLEGQRNFVARSFLRIRQVFKSTLIIADGYNYHDGNSVIIDKATDLVAFGRLFLANPDLPRRFELNATFNPIDEEGIYSGHPVKGYTDYPFLDVVEEEIPRDIILPAVVKELFNPYKMGKFNLAHRVVLAPMTMNRSYYSIPQPHAAVYYSQRATRGGLLISETTAVSEMGKGHVHTPGIWTRQQVTAWKPIVDVVHDKGGIFFCNIGHFGRDIKIDGRTPVSSTDQPYTSILFDEVGVVPRRLRVDELPGIVNDFKLAARNAIDAGFDGVQIEGGNELLIEQFLDEEVNNRNDEYGGTLENRCRFALEIVKSVALEIGAYRVGFGLSPWSNYLFDRVPGTLLGKHMAKALSELNILYLHGSEGRVIVAHNNDLKVAKCLHGMRSNFRNSFIATNGYDRAQAINVLSIGYTDLVSFGRLFVANPDLPRRFQLGADLNMIVPATTESADPVHGYTDYQFLQ